jgi:hypothetical protein
VSQRSLNYLTLAIFAPILILTGVAGFIVPASLSLTSGAGPYNIFHICFGTLGLILVLTKIETAIACFNFGFGLIDLYQAVASYLRLPPREYFLWTKIDDILHILIGLALVFIGAYGFWQRRRRSQ